MDLAKQLRHCMAEGGSDRFDRIRESFQLTVLPLHDLPGCLVFSIYELRPHGWWPLIAGRVTHDDELVVTCGDEHNACALPQLLEFLLTDAGVPNWTRPDSVVSIA